MTLDEKLLLLALDCRDRLEATQDLAEQQRGEFHRSVRHLHIAGGSMREIAEALGLSHQRVHQIVERGDPAAVPAVKTPLTVDPGLLRCTFCGLSQKQVAKLIAGPGVYICGECVRRVALAGGGHDDGAFTATSVPTTQCAFCGKHAKTVAWLVTAEREGSRICDQCVALCEEIIEEESPGSTPPPAG